MPPLRWSDLATGRSAYSRSTNGTLRSANGANGTNGNGKADPQALSSAIPITWPQEQRIRKILQRVQEDPAQRIHELATQFNLSHSHLQHLFKQQTGVQLGHLLLEYRLQKAAHLLEHSIMSVKEIAYAVGYEHTSSFIRAFERRFRIAPRGYRQQNGHSKY